MGQWSPDLVEMLPELADAFLSLSTEQRCTLEEKLEEYSIFIDNVKLPNLVIIQMTTNFRDINF